MFMFNKKSFILERKGDFKFAMDVLFLKETIEYL